MEAGGDPFIISFGSRWLLEIQERKYNFSRQIEFVGCLNLEIEADGSSPKVRHLKKIKRRL